MKLMLADCLEAMRELEDASVDAVVTDPPYGISFMAKHWDRFDIDARVGKRDVSQLGVRLTGGIETPNRKETARTASAYANPAGEAGGYDFSLKGNRAFQQWTEQWAREACRVLKPGGHLLCFAATRTYHRMAAGVEDAGFEIRDQLAWMFGSGFPKSLDVSKAIDKKRDDLDETYEVTRWIRSARDAAGMSNADIDEAFDANGMGRHWTDVLPGGLQPAVPTLQQIPPLLALLGVTDDEVPERIRHLIFTLNGRKGEPGEAWKNAEVVGEYDGVPGGFGDLRFNVRDNLIREPSIAASAWEGWGTALKPAFEPIVLARKPLGGTVAATLLEHGTGALNIDGCRIGFQDEADERESKEKNRHADFGTEPGGNAVYGDYSMVESKNYDAPGRWPANVLLDDEAAALLDEQTGELAAGNHPALRSGRSEEKVYGSGWSSGTEGERRATEAGGASRFFYCAKVSRSERHAGLDGFDKRPLNWSSGEQSPGTFQGEGTDRSSRNFHPTVKPLDLMRWLLRLVTPPGGTVLDPFLGSGSTGCAAALEGFEFIGCEREPDYLAIAEARIAFWTEHGDDGLRIVRERDAAESKRAKVVEAGQLDLLSEDAAA